MHVSRDVRRQLGRDGPADATGGGSEYDGVSASGDASNRLDRGRGRRRGRSGAVPGDGERDRSAEPRRGTNNHYIVGDNVYGVAVHVRAELPHVQHRRVSPAPTSWDVTFESDSPVRGQRHRLRVPDLHRRRGHVSDGDQPDLGISDPYELTQEQFDASVDAPEATEGVDQRLLGALHRRDRRLRGRLDGRLARRGR